MHIQSGVPGWPDALRAMPDGYLVKAFDPSVLREARQVWAAAGRNPAKLYTDYRHYDFIYPFDRHYSWEELKHIWRTNFRRFIDRTYLEQYTAYVDMVEELNEYYDTRMAHDPAILAPFLNNARAAVAIWNEEYRGKTVTSADGGRGEIPASCKLVIGNSPVGNDIAREFYQLAISSDNILGIHPYSKWHNSVRDPQDFRYHSGRPFFHESEYGLKPVYANTECGPYFDAAQGWRAGVCMGGNQDLLVSGMRAWIRDVATTAAYRDGRILGPGAFFTSGGGDQWRLYELETPQLLALAGMLRDEWHPGTGDDMPPLDDVSRARIKVLAQEIIHIAEGKWWLTLPLPFTIPAVNRDVTMYHADGSPFVPAKVLRVTWAMTVTAVAGDLLLVHNPDGTAGDLWVRGADLPVPAAQG